MTTNKICCRLTPIAIAAGLTLLVACSVPEPSPIPTRDPVPNVVTAKYNSETGEIDLDEASYKLRFLLALAADECHRCMEHELDQDFEWPRFSDIVEGEVYFRQFANAVVEAEADRAREACKAEVHPDLNFE